jgi:hypothetical protein
MTYDLAVQIKAFVQAVYPTQAASCSDDKSAYTIFLNFVGRSGCVYFCCSHRLVSNCMSKVSDLWRGVLSECDT